ncbi:MAG: hypothetical protein ACRCYU_23505 [Nocardioides sp.]
MSNDLSNLSGADAEVVKADMLGARAELAAKTAELKEIERTARADIDAKIKAMQAEMNKQIAEATALMAPMLEKVQQLEEGIWTVNLYLGVGEELVQLAEGAPAAADVPIHLRQSVLAMDEEVAAFPTADRQGMDFRSISVFDRWITEDPAHLTQVLPEERGIVALTPRATEIDYGDPILNTVLNKENFASYWLIRNGGNLWRLRTDFAVGRHLMPTTAEFTSLFQQTSFDGTVTPIEPGSKKWMEAEKAQGAKQRHYMRVALILQGLIDRTEILHPLPGEVSVLRQSAYDDGLVVVLADDEKQIGSGRKPYYEWLRELNAELRPGMRIIGDFHAKHWREHKIEERNWTRRHGNWRLSPTGAEMPKSNTLHTIESTRELQGDKGLVIRYARTEKVWDDNMWVESETRPGWGHRGGERVPERRASAVVFREDRNIIPFDLVTEVQLLEYLGARTERHAYADMMPLLQAALAAKRAEAEAEAPFRDLIHGVLGADATEDDVERLVHRWKLANKWHRPLVDPDPAVEAKAIKAIKAEWARERRTDVDEAADTKAVAALLEVDPSIMWIGRRTGGGYLALAPQPRTAPHGMVRDNLWVVEYTTSKTARKIDRREWVIPGVRANKLHTLHATAGWDSWDKLSTARDDLRDDQLLDLAEEVAADGMVTIRHEYPEAGLLGVTHDPAKRQLRLYAFDPSMGDATHVRYLRVSAEWKRDAKGRAAIATNLSDRWVDAETWDVDWKTKEAVAPWKDRAAICVAESLLVDAMNMVNDRYAESSRRAAVKRRVYGVLRSLREQQIEALYEQAKVDFMAKYADEQMWDERRSKMRRPDPEIDFQNDRHFHERIPFEGGGGYYFGDKLPGIDIDEAIRRLIERDDPWHGLTMAAAYAELGHDLPALYAPYAELVLRDPETEDV